MALLFVIIFALFESKQSYAVGFHKADGCRIFCKGPLLKAVQNAHIFHDSKDFVDMPMKHNLDTILKAFDNLSNKSDPDAVRAFVNEHFLPPGAELEACIPSDWVPKPKSFDKIKDQNYRKWAYDIHSLWRSLCRRVKDDVRWHSQFYSLISVPFNFIAPGGRFREFYYWDTYWIIKGLLASEMTTTAKNMIRNLGDMIRRFDFVPNGGRIYYLQRSQPPLLAGCVQDYYNYTKDLGFVKEMLPLLDKEFEFWINERSVDWRTDSGDHHQLFQYRSNQDEPRPESYKEDVSSAEHADNEIDQIKIWSNIAAAAESGWDFSSRWFSKDGDFKNTIKSIKTNRIVPVDLNAFICWNQLILSNLHKIAGNQVASEKYNIAFEHTKLTMSKTFWDEQDGIWYDLDLDTMQKSKFYYASNLTPLFGQCTLDIAQVPKKVLDYLKNVKALEFPGGLPTSLQQTGEQWDQPNGWAPTNHMAIEGLRGSSDEIVQQAAFELAEKWIHTNYFAFVRSGGKMFEKYNVEKTNSAAGSGGEYEVQEGFGWTNGVILDLLLTYGDRLVAPDVPPIVVNGNNEVIPQDFTISPVHPVLVAAPYHFPMKMQGFLCEEIV